MPRTAAAGSAGKRAAAAHPRAAAHPPRPGPGARRGLTGDLVHVRAPTAADREEFLARVRDSRRLHRPWVNPPATAAAYRAWLRRAGPDFVPLLACRRSDGAIVGVVALGGIVLGNLRCAHLEYYAFHPFQRRGYLADALRVVVRLSFGRLGLHRLEANVQPRNAASLRLVRRCGFRREGFSPRYLAVGGRWRDHERWAVLADDDRR